MKRLCSNLNTPWQHIPKSLLADVGGTELFNCNYDYDFLDLNNRLPAFYKRIIFLLAGHCKATPKNKNEVLSQPIWNNRFLTVNKKMLFLPDWYQAGIMFLMVYVNQFLTSIKRPANYLSIEMVADIRW